MSRTEPRGRATPSDARSAPPAQIETLEVRRVLDGIASRGPDELVVEASIRLVVNGGEALRVTGSPVDLEAWAFGVLLSEGCITTSEDVDRLEIDGTDVSVRLRHGPRAPEAPRPIASKTVLPLPRCLELLADAAARGGLFARTGGTHFAAIACDEGIRFAFEDVSRTCALEKALGASLLATDGKPSDLLLLSCRVSAQLLRKAARAGIPIVAAVSAATADAVRLADSLGVCLCGFARGARATVYSHPWRVGLT
jgi:FdhD protein